jgi:hypothetical protein
LTTLRKIFLSAIVVFSFTTAFPQQMFSIASDVSIQRNFKKEQLYWALGHTTNAIFHLTPKDGIYLWFAYYSNGRFNNNLTAVARSPLTAPQQVSYLNSARMRLKQFSVGWRKYLRGSPDAETGYNIYGYAGFGLLLGRMDNSHSVSIDTVLYNVPVLSGKANFKRLTVDLGIGWEIPIGGDFYFFTEGKVWVPASNYPSKYIFVNNNAPYVAMLGTGIRIVF